MFSVVVYITCTQKHIIRALIANPVINISVRIIQASSKPPWQRDVRPAIKAVQHPRGDVDPGMPRPATHWAFAVPAAVVQAGHNRFHPIVMWLSRTYSMYGKAFNTDPMVRELIPRPPIRAAASRADIISPGFICSANLVIRSTVQCCIISHPGHSGLSYCGIGAASRFPE